VCSVTRIIWVIELALAVGGVQSALAETYHSESFGFSIDVPDGWVRVPDEVVQQSKMILFSRKAQTKIIFDAAFQQTEGDRWFHHPYVVIQVCPYAFLGADHIPTEAEFPYLIERTSGSDGQRMLDEMASDQAREAMTDSQQGEVELDREARRYRLPVAIEAPAIGTIRGEFTGFFGRRAIVQLMFYDLEGGWNDSAAVRQQLAGSFRFDANAAYPAGPKRALADGRENGAMGWSSTILVGVAVLIVVGVVCAIALRRKSAGSVG